MLSVKHIHVGGSEDVFEAARVFFAPGNLNASAVISDERKIGPAIYIETAGGDVSSPYSEGTFYVMNGSGKTVAKYELAGIEVGGGDHERLLSLPTRRVQSR